MCPLGQSRGVPAHSQFSAKLERGPSEKLRARAELNATAQRKSHHQVRTTEMSIERSACGDHGTTIRGASPRGRRHYVQHLRRAMLVRVLRQHLDSSGLRDLFSFAV